MVVVIVMRERERESGGGSYCGECNEGSPCLHCTCAPLFTCALFTLSLPPPNTTQWSLLHELCMCATVHQLGIGDHEGSFSRVSITLFDLWIVIGEW